MITIDTSREAVAPERIWLQTSGDYAAARTAGPELTWCDRPQGDGDHEYVRADLYATLKAERERLREAVQRQVTNIERWLETGEPANEIESESIYNQLVAALGDA